MKRETDLANNSDEHIVGANGCITEAKQLVNSGKVLSIFEKFTFREKENGFQKTELSKLFCFHIQSNETFSATCNSIYFIVFVFLSHYTLVHQYRSGIILTIELKTIVPTNPSPSSSLSSHNTLATHAFCLPFEGK